MDEKAALRRIFDAQSVWLNKAKEEHRLKEAHSAVKKEMDDANAGLCAIIEEYRTGQEQLPFEGAGGKAAADANLDRPGGKGGSVRSKQSLKWERKKKAELAKALLKGAAAKAPPLDPAPDPTVKP